MRVIRPTLGRDLKVVACTATNWGLVYVYYADNFCFFVVLYILNLHSISSLTPIAFFLILLLIFINYFSGIFLMYPS